jgi:alkanesulfonate monooxygenase SsuD/methylene tetrahydromethanopterin reductase-like flavin-dependent oxidoreductase (luciferase family)
MESLPKQLEYASHADRVGFDRIWRGESRLVRSGIVALTAYAQVTEDIELATGVLPIWTRNVALMAQTWTALHELAGPRVSMGVGAWWEPLASMVGVDRKKPLRALWEYCTVAKRLFDLENVTYDGEVVKVDSIELDMIHTDVERANIPIYIGATGPQMNTMAGELAAMGIIDGVYMNYLTPPSHTETIVQKQREGAEERGGDLEDVDRPQMIGVSMDEDADEAIDNARDLVAQYIGQQPHIRKHCGISQNVGEKIRSELNEWPASEADVNKVRDLVPDDVVTNVVAAGTPEDVVQKVRDYYDAGATEPSLYCIEDTDPKSVMNVFSEHTNR